MPFDVCNITGLIYMPLILLARNQVLFDGVFLTAFLATIQVLANTHRRGQTTKFDSRRFIAQAFITPHLFDEFPHITFIKFFIVHGGIILSCLVAAGR